MRERGHSTKGEGAREGKLGVIRQAPKRMRRIKRWSWPKEVEGEQIGKVFQEDGRISVKSTESFSEPTLIGAVILNPGCEF